MISRIKAYFRVRRGARLLDRKQVGWWWQVDPESVDVRSATLCPLGQIWGFVSGLCRVGIQPFGGHSMRRLGFCCPLREEEAIYNARWREEIRKRRRK